MGLSRGRDLVRSARSLRFVFWEGLLYAALLTLRWLGMRSFVHWLVSAVSPSPGFFPGCWVAAATQRGASARESLIHQSASALALY